MSRDVPTWLAPTLCSEGHPEHAQAFRVVDETHYLATLHELGLLMDTFHIYPHCRDGMARRGWHHDESCKHWPGVTF